MKSMKRALTVPAAFLSLVAAAGWVTRPEAQAQQPPEMPIPGPGPHEERQFLLEPAPEAAPTGAPAAALATTMIYFDTGRSDLREEAKAALAEIATLLKENPNAMVLVEGHTDAVGGELYNLQLGQARAYTAREYLLKENGIEPRRIQAAAFGKAVPAADNSTEEGRAMNRRVTLRVMPMGSPLAGLR